MTVLATDPMLTRIEDSISSSIRAMKRGTYNLTWGSVNEPDEVKQVYPSSEVKVVDETSLDDKDGAWNQVYMQECTYEITVRAKLKRESNNPQYEIDLELNKCLDDLKKLFGNSPNLGNSTCAMIAYRGFRRVDNTTGDTLAPKYMITTWRVTYTQDRTSPSVSADA